MLTILIPFIDFDIDQRCCLDAPLRLAYKDLRRNRRCLIITAIVMFITVIGCCCADYNYHS